MPETVLITGCSTGLGRALSLQLAQVRSNTGEKLFRVFATARDVHTLCGLEKEGVECLAINVTEDASVTAAVQRTVAAAGQVDVLICNAGIAATAPLAEQGMSDVEAIFQTNTLGALRCIQAVAPLMIARRRGRIIVTGSITALLASPFNGSYAASKAALHSICETLAMELEPFNVSLTEIWAGTMKTAINSKVSGSLERYAKPTSAYHLIAAEIRERSEILETGKAMSPEQAAAPVVQALVRGRRPRYISTGADVTKYTLLGAMQCWLCPGGIGRAMQDKFGLAKLRRLIAAEGTPSRSSAAAPGG